MYDTLSYHHVKFTDVLDLIEKDLPSADTDFDQKLMPSVLESIQLYADLKEKVFSSSNFIGPLSVLYEIMREWRIHSPCLTKHEGGN